MPNVYHPKKRTFPKFITIIATRIQNLLPNNPVTDSHTWQQLKQGGWSDGSQAVSKLYFGLGQI